MALADPYSCWLSSSAGLYQSKLDAVLPGVARDALHELRYRRGSPTHPGRPPLDSQPLAVNQAFFEFVPAEVELGGLLDAGERVETLLFDEVEAGRDYHLIMTQANGLYRLWSGDIYRVDRVADGVPGSTSSTATASSTPSPARRSPRPRSPRRWNRRMAAYGVEGGLYLCGPQLGRAPHYAHGRRSTAPRRRVGPGCRRGGPGARNHQHRVRRPSATSGRLGPLEFHTVGHDTIAAYTECRRQRGNTTQYKYSPFQKDTDFVADLVGGASESGIQR